MSRNKDGSNKDQRNLSMKEISHLLKRLNTGDGTALVELKQQCLLHDLSTISYKDSGDTVIHVAAKTGLFDVVKCLIVSDPKIIDAKNKDCKTALHEAAQNAHYNICESLVQHGADVNAIKRADWTPLMLACTKIIPVESLKIVELFLEKGAIIDYKNKDGWTALHLICRHGNPEILKCLFKHGANVKLKTKNGRTALHIAALHGNVNVLRILLDLGLNVEEQDSCGNTPLHEAVLGNSLDVCRTLIDKGADIYSANKMGYNVLHLAASQGHLGVIKFILDDRHWALNEATKDGFTALHCAAKNQHRETYNYLVEAGADPTIRDKRDRGAFQLLRNTDL